MLDIQLSEDVEGFQFYSNLIFEIFIRFYFLDNCRHELKFYTCTHSGTLGTKYGGNRPRRSNHRTKVLYKYLLKFLKKTIILQTRKLVKFESKTTGDDASFTKKIIIKINVLS